MKEKHSIGERHSIGENSVEKKHLMKKRFFIEKKRPIEKYSRKNFRAIQAIVESKTGVSMVSGRGLAGYQIRRMAVVAAGLLCLVTLSAFAYAKFSDLNGDDAGFAAAYQGEGRFEIVVINNSDRELELQDQVKVMQWSTGKAAEGDNGKIRMEVPAIAPHSQGIVSIDISEGYDVRAMQENLPEGDGYYFVLTNNNFAFGQDWMCFFDFETERTEDVENRMAEAMEQRKERQEEAGPQYAAGSLAYPDWIWPTVSRNVSGVFGRQENGADSDHINIAGTSGDEIYAVADGVVTEADFEGRSGNYIVVDLGGVLVKYGHLDEIKVSVGDEVKQGQVIASMGKTGMATGPNLLFEVTVDGQKVNPLAEE